MKNYLSNNQCLIFFHIYKTAGTTLRDIILRNFRKNEICWMPDHKSKHPLDEMPETDRRKLKLVYGHMQWGLHTLLPKKTRYITVLRNPVDRIVSEYYYNIHHPEFPNYSRILEMGLTDPLKFAKSGLFRLADNGQVRLLGNQYQKPFGSIGRDDFDQAINNISSFFDCIGTVEYFDEMILLLARLYGWKRPYYTRLNQGEKRSRLDEKMMLEIREMNEWDEKLCDFANNRLLNQMSSMTVDWKKELEKFRNKNANYQAVLKARVHLNLLFRRGHRNEGS